LALEINCLLNWTSAIRPEYETSKTTPRCVLISQMLIFSSFFYFKEREKQKQNTQEQTWVAILTIDCFNLNGNLAEKSIEMISTCNNNNQ
jgi:hypothetical protein